MNINTIQPIKSLFAALALTLLLSGCDEYYARPDSGYQPGYNPGYDGVSDRRMIKNCKQRVEHKISRKLGRDTWPEYGYVDVNDISRYQARVKGDAYVTDRNSRLRIDYRCVVERNNGEVTNVKLDWRNKPGHGGGNQGNAASHCKTHISKKVQKDTKGRVSVDFGKHDSTGLSGNRRKITGNARVTANHGVGKIRYECVVNTDYMRVNEGHYRWTQHLPSGGNGGLDKDKAKRTCHKAILHKVNRDGYKNVAFKSTHFRGVGNSELMVTGKINMKRQGQHHRANYSCRVNGRNGNVKSANYQMDYK